MSKIVVHKYGSSVLADESRLEAVVDSIYGALRAGYRVVAVVSAMGDTTDTLIAEARQFGEGLDDSALAMLLSTGELRSASLLTMALARAGISSGVLDAAAIGLRTRGPSLDAEPLSVRTEWIESGFENRSVWVVPGFLGRDDQGQTTLLGRGGSDLTALFWRPNSGLSVFYSKMWMVSTKLTPIPRLSQFCGMRPCPGTRLYKSEAVCSSQKLWILLVVGNSISRCAHWEAVRGVPLGTSRF